MATLTTALLVVPVQLTAADAAYYTSPANQSSQIGRAVFFNSDTVSRNITINVTNATSSAANQVIQRSIAPNETYVSPELAGFVIPPGYALRGLSDVAAKVTMAISGLIITQ